MEIRSAFHVSRPVAIRLRGECFPGPCWQWLIMQLLQNNPLIRQISVAGADQDLISRNIKLEVKEQGAYQVIGKEGDNSDWKFEYLVLDRYTSRGILMSGERVT